MENFSFPLFLLAFVLAIAGVWRKVLWLPVLSAALSMPMVIYLFGASDIGFFAVLIPLGMLGSAVALQKQKTRLAWLLLLPMAIIFALLALGLAAWLSLGR